MILRRDYKRVSTQIKNNFFFDIFLEAAIYMTNSQISANVFSEWATYMANSQRVLMYFLREKFS